jgi:flagellin
MNMLTGAFSMDSPSGRIMQLQIGANMDQNARVYVNDMSAGALGLMDSQGNVGKLSIADPAEANLAIGTIDSALKQVSKQRADLGAYQNRFEMAAQGVAIAAENLQAAESRIRDTNMANKMVDYTRDSILTQTGTAMLAQANLRSQSVLALLS